MAAAVAPVIKAAAPKVSAKAARSALAAPSPAPAPPDQVFSVTLFQPDMCDCGNTIERIGRFATAVLAQAAARRIVIASIRSNYEYSDIEIDPEAHFVEHWQADGTGFIFAKEGGPDNHGGGFISMRLAVDRI